MVRKGGLVNIVKCKIVLIMLSMTGFTQDINISGKVTDAGMTVLPSAFVKLEKNGNYASTDMDGLFTLTGAVNSSNTNNKFPGFDLTVRKYRDFFILDLHERGEIEVITYTLHGRAINTFKQTLDCG